MPARRAVIDVGQLAAQRMSRAPAPQPGGWLHVNWATVLATFLAAIAGLLPLAATALLWAGAMSSRVAALETGIKDLSTVPATLATLDERSRDQGEQLKYLVAQQDSVRRWAQADARRRHGN